VHNRFTQLLRAHRQRHLPRRQLPQPAGGSGRTWQRHGSWVPAKCAALLVLT
jgi:hypothetical protein